MLGFYYWGSRYIKVMKLTSNKDNLQPHLKTHKVSKEHLELKVLKRNVILKEM